MRRHLSRKQAVIAAAVGALLIEAVPAMAQVNYYWDPTSTASTTGGGSGTWDMNQPLWFDGISADIAWPSVSSGTDIANFGGTAGTVTIASGTTITADQLLFASDGYVIDGGDSSSALNLDGATAEIGVGTGSTATINANLTGSTNFAIGDATNTGAVVLSGTSSGYTGHIALSTAHLQLNSSSSAGLLGNAALDVDAGTGASGTGATLNLRGDVTNTTPFFGGGVTIIGAGGHPLAVDVNSSSSGTGQTLNLGAVTIPSGNTVGLSLTGGNGYTLGISTLDVEGQLSIAPKTAGVAVNVGNIVGNNNVQLALGGNWGGAGKLPTDVNNILGGFGTASTPLALSTLYIQSQEYTLNGSTYNVHLTSSNGFYIGQYQPSIVNLGDATHQSVVLTDTTPGAGPIPINVRAHSRLNVYSPNALANSAVNMDVHSSWRWANVLGLYADSDTTFQTSGPVTFLGGGQHNNEMNVNVDPITPGVTGKTLSLANGINIDTTFADGGDMHLAVTSDSGANFTADLGAISIYSTTGNLSPVSVTLLSAPAQGGEYDSTPPSGITANLKVNIASVTDTDAAPADYLNFGDFQYPGTGTAGGHNPPFGVGVPAMYTNVSATIGPIIGEYTQIAFNSATYTLTAVNTFTIDGNNGQYFEVGLYMPATVNIGDATHTSASLPATSVNVHGGGIFTEGGANIPLDPSMLVTYNPAGLSALTSLTLSGGTPTQGGILGLRADSDSSFSTPAINTTGAFGFDVNQATAAGGNNTLTLPASIDLAATGYWRMDVTGGNGDILHLTSPLNVPAGGTNAPAINPTSASVVIDSIVNNLPSDPGGLNYLNLSGSSAGNQVGSISGTGDVRVNGGDSGSPVWTLTGASSYTGSTTVTKGTLEVGGDLTSTSGISVASGATLRLLPNGPFINTANLNLASGSTLDVTKNTVHFDTTVAGHDAATLSGLVAAAYDGGHWDQPGISTSAADTQHGLGWADNSAAHDLTVKYTWYGDANLDGQVDVTDLGALATNWQTASNWAGGDFNYDGFVDVTDLGALATNWQQGVGNPLGPSLQQALAAVGLGGVSVPEPASLSLFALAGLGLLQRRHRVRSGS